MAMSLCGHTLVHTALHALAICIAFVLPVVGNVLFLFGNALSLFGNALYLLYFGAMSNEMWPVVQACGATYLL